MGVAMEIVQIMAAIALDIVRIPHHLLAIFIRVNYYLLLLKKVKINPTFILSMKK
jgi:hypothetical protein